MQLELIGIILGIVIYLQTLQFVRFYLLNTWIVSNNVLYTGYNFQLYWNLIMHDSCNKIVKRSLGIRRNNLSVVKVHITKSCFLSRKPEGEGSQSKGEKLWIHSSQTKLYNAWENKVSLCHERARERFYWSLCTWISHTWYVFMCE